MTYREFVMKNVASHIDRKDYILLGALGLCSESGEAADIVKKFKFQGAQLNREKLIKELGDVRWYFEVLCEALGTSIEEIERINIEKLNVRFPNGFSAEASAAKKDEK